MGQRYKASFIRGGTSKALVFHVGDLPADRSAWDAVFLRALGSPDRYGRQLNGMGGGISSLSKVCVVGPPSVAQADVDYTFVQVQVRQALADYSGNCGNMSSAIGPFAVDEGLVPAPADGLACVRIHNTNTGKIIHAHFPVKDGRSVEEGELVIPGVDGSGAPVRLDFLAPGGASTGRLLPSGQATQWLDIPGRSPVQVSLVDAANACVFVAASDLGLQGDELPEALEARAGLLDWLADIRGHGAVAMGLCQTVEQARQRPMIPLVACVAPPQDSCTLDGERMAAAQADVLVRMVSSGQPHRALPLTGALCTAVALRVPGTVVARVARVPAPGQAIRLAMPSGVLTVSAEVQSTPEGWYAASGSFYRTTRRLFDGMVHA